MPISTACPGCQQRLKLADGLIGKRVRCPKCQQAFLVPPDQHQEHIQKQIQPTARPARLPEPLLAPFGDDDDDARARPARSRKRDDSRDSRERDDFDAPVTIDGHQAYRIASHMTVELSGMVSDIETLQYYIKGPNNKAFVVTFAADPTRFAGLRKKFEQSAQTIQID